MSDLEVLLVEDNPPDATYVEELFRDISWQSNGHAGESQPALTHVETLSDAREHIETDGCDVVLLDLNLPDSTELDTVEGMLSSVDDQPVVVLTGLQDEEVGVEAVERGAQDYLVKDELNTSLLGRTLQYALERERRTRELQRQYDRFETIVENVPVVFFVIDADGIFRVSEGSALANLGLEPGEVVGESVFDVYADHERVVSDLERALDGEELTVTIDIAGRTFRTRYRPVHDESGDVEEVIGLSHDITEQVQRKRQLEQYQETVKAVPDAVWMLDSDGRFTTVNDGVCALTDRSREELLGSPVDEIVEADTIDTFERRIAEQLQAEESAHYVTRTPITMSEGETIPAETHWTVRVEDGEFRGTVGVTRDISDQLAYEESLRRLHDAGEKLQGVQSAEAVCDIIAEAAEDLRDVDVAGAFLFEPERNALVPAAFESGGQQYFDEVATFGPDEGLAWETFLDGETRSFPDVSTADGVYNEETPVGHEIQVPLGDWGVLLVGNTAVGAIGEQTVELLEILGSNARVALERIEREQSVRERDEQLQARARRLAQLEGINERVRKIAHELVGATTRKEVERIVCDRIVNTDTIAFAWVGSVQPDGSVTPSTWAGTHGGYLDDISLSGASGERKREPSIRASDQRETVVVETVSEELHDGRWQRVALSRRLQSVCAVPLSEGGVPYGVLTVYATQAGFVDESTAGVLSELGETTSHAIRSVDQRQALLGEGLVELEFTLDGPSTPLANLSTALECSVRVQRVIQQEDDAHLVYAVLENVDQSAVTESATDVLGIKTVRVLSDQQDVLRCELVVSGTSVPGAIAGQGGTLESLQYEGGSGTVTTSVASGMDVGRFIDQFVERFPGSELGKRRTIEATRETPEELDSVDLTERQHEVLTTAFHSGFFEWPRESTGEEVAETLDVSAPTFQEHLRRAERRLLATLLGKDAAPSDEL